MKLPKEIWDEVKKIASKRNSGVLSSAIIEHNREVRHKFNPVHHRGKSNSQLIQGSCQCDYCKYLRRYVHTKLVHHRLKRSLDKDYFPPKTIYKIGDLEEYLRSLEEKISKYKRIKDEVKEDLKI